MASLIKFIKDNKDFNPVEFPGGAHYKFEIIRPFGDADNTHFFTYLDNISNTNIVLQLSSAYFSQKKLKG